MHISLKHIVFFIFIFLTITSCRSKKTFKGTETLKCTTFKDSKKEAKNKKNSKYEIVVLKDGKRIGGKKKKRRKGKSRLFKKK
tara:strand:- start:597 stop:845 length:249 start_codon:yes stop_codon:yes gene_type:complete